jgi:hypothetical protein
MGSDGSRFAELAETTIVLHYFSELPDHRQVGKVEYPLPEVLLLVLLAVLAGPGSATRGPLDDGHGAWSQLELCFGETTASAVCIERFSVQGTRQPAIAHALARSALVTISGICSA